MTIPIIQDDRRTEFEWDGNDLDAIMPIQVSVSRPTRYSDGHGGYTEYPDVTALMYCGMVYDGSAVSMIFGADQDLRIGDFVLAPVEAAAG